MTRQKMKSWPYMANDHWSRISITDFIWRIDMYAAKATGANQEILKMVGHSMLATMIFQRKKF